MGKRLAHRSVVVACVIAASMLFAVLLAMRSRHSQIQPPHASLRLSRNVVDLGSTSVQKEWSVPFQVCNSGKIRLVINKVDTACCGDSAQETIIIPPGKTVEVAVNLDTRFTTGSVENTASFTTSAPDCPRLDLTVQAWVVGDQSTSPSAAEHPQAVSVLNRN